MMQNYVESLNSGKIPSIQKAWEFIVQNECIIAYNECIDVYNEGLKQHFKEDACKRSDEIYHALRNIRDQTLDMYFQIAGIRQGNNPYYIMYKDKLLEFMDGKEELAFGINHEISASTN